MDDQETGALENEQKALQKAFEQRNVKQQHDGLLALACLAKAGAIPDEINESLPIWFEYFFCALRWSRNEAGHPTGVRTDPDEVFGMLQVFPSFAARLLALQEHIKANP